MPKKPKMSDLMWQAQKRESRAERKAQAREQQREQRERRERQQLAALEAKRQQDAVYAEYQPVEGYGGENLVAGIREMRGKGYLVHTMVHIPGWQGRAGATVVVYRKKEDW